MKSIRILMNSDGDHTKSNDGSFHAGCLKKHPMTLGAESCSIPVPYLFHTCCIPVGGDSWEQPEVRSVPGHTNPNQQVWNTSGTNMERNRQSNL